MPKKTQASRKFHRYTDKMNQAGRKWVACGKYTCYKFKFQIKIQSKIHSCQCGKQGHNL